MKVLTEASLAKCVIAWLQEEQWDVYQEVSFRGYVIDIVATRGPLIGVVECKQAMGFPVLEQAYRSAQFANFTWAAFWRPLRDARPSLGHAIAKHIGIGLIAVPRSHNNYPENVKVTVEPTFRRRIATTPVLREHLHSEQQSGYAEAGTNRGGYFTPWRRTCDELRRIVESNPGIAIRDAIEGIRHHYGSKQSARASLLHWAEKGVISGVTVRRNGKRVELIPTEVTP